MNLDMEVALPGTLEEMEAGGLLTVPGWYRAVVEDVEQSERIEGALNFRYKISAGPHKGSIISDTLFDPSQAEDETKAASAMRKLGMYAGRLGIWDGKPGQAVRVNWTKAIGREVVIHVTAQSWNDKTTNEKKSKVGIDYSGVYPLDHYKIPGEQRKALALPPARPRTDASSDPKGNGSMPAPTQRKKVDITGL